MRGATRRQVFAAINSERAYQDDLRAKNGDDPSERERKTLEQFGYYMEDYLREMKTQLSRTWGPTAYDAALDTMRKVTAMGVAAMETWGAPQRPGFGRTADETED